MKGKFLMLKYQQWSEIAAVINRQLELHTGLGPTRDAIARSAIREVALNIADDLIPATSRGYFLNDCGLSELNPEAQ